MTPPAMLGGDALLGFLIQLLILLGVAIVLGRLAVRIGMPPIVGELFTGIVLGPSLLGHALPGVAERLLPQTAEAIHMLDAVAQLGVLLLVGLTATHLDFALVRRRRGTALRVSACGLAVPLAFGVALGYAVPGPLLPEGVNRMVFALFMAVAMGVTAIPVIAKTLTDMRLMHRDIGQLALVSGALDDVVAWFLLSIVAALASAALTAGAVLKSVLSLIGFVVLGVAVGLPLLRLLFRRFARAEDQRVAVTVAVVLAGAAASHALGLEAVFGAFVAGGLAGLAGGAAGVGGLRIVVNTVLAPLFLAMAGLRVDLTTLADGPTIAIAAAALAVAVAGKFAGAFLGARLSRLGRWEGLALGAAMNSRGVVEVVIATVGLRLGILDVRFYSIVVLIAVVTSVMAPPLLRIFMNRIDETHDERERAVLQMA